MIMKTDIKTVSYREKKGSMRKTKHKNGNIGHIDGINSLVRWNFWEGNKQPVCTTCQSSSCYRD